MPASQESCAPDQFQEVLSILDEISESVERLQSQLVGIRDATHEASWILDRTARYLSALKQSPECSKAPRRPPDDTGDR